MINKLRRGERRGHRLCLCQHQPDSGRASLQQREFLSWLLCQLQFTIIFLLLLQEHLILQLFQDHKNLQHFFPKKILAIYHISNLHFPKYNVPLQEYKIYRLLQTLLKALLLLAHFF
jgi:hypothetical protein